MQTSDPAPTVLTVSGVTKRFPGVTALQDVDFQLRGGEVHVLFGENGAGKSTLVNILAGTYAPDEGTVTVRGEPVTQFAPYAARRRGINSVFQEFSLVPTLSVAENLFLGREPGRGGFIDRRAARALAAKALGELDPTFPLDARVGTLSRAQQQVIEIAKALLGDPAILILDEPTASLSDHEVDVLFGLIAQLKARGIGLIYITHRMNEIRRIGDRITVLRDGRHVATLDVADAEDDRLIELMTGRTLDALYPRAARRDGRVALRLDGVSGPGVEDVSLEVRTGEVVGIAGLVGSGKSTVGRLCFGLDRTRGGSIHVGERALSERSTPREALEAGLIYYPADRRGEGLVLPRPVQENLVLSRLESRVGLLRRRDERRHAERAIERLSIHPADPGRRAALLSGGNQQKVVLARALLHDVDVHVFDEPTVGIDVGARVQVYEFIKELCERGKAVLLISSDLPEVVHLSHRLYVMHQGRVAAELEGDAITEEAVLTNFFSSEAA
jgi:ribose transport system ATP-binding protein